MTHTDYTHLITLPHPSGDYLGYAEVDTDTGTVYTTDTHCDAHCRVGATSTWTPVDMCSKYMTDDLWVLGGWHNEEDFDVDCSCEGYGRDSGTGWVERQLLKAIPREFAIRRGIV